jgi:hypothetical protein
VACRIKVLGYMEDLRSTYIFAEFLYLYQLTLHPSPNTPLISTKLNTTGCQDTPTERKRRSRQNSQGSSFNTRTTSDSKTANGEHFTSLSHYTAIIRNGKPKTQRNG